ncbi:hypothetical protein Y032_0019g3906 [Ancylostoma ceylanicum]|uniref:Uncharacterized protein n=1 Tax=Ancylostoma ceylanicum TaxID=53326 RepID=A0A016V2W3_9BILA|nr:hypothetical protein Y032_0019g3906 [Ancylostoma ceylanicum]
MWFCKAHRKVKQVTRGQSKNTQNKRLLDEFSDRLKPTLRFHVEETSLSMFEFDDAIVKAITYESFLADVANSTSIVPVSQPALPTDNMLAPTRERIIKESQEKRATKE